MTTWRVSFDELDSVDIKADACGILDGCLTFWNPREVDEPPVRTYEDIENGVEPDGVMVKAFAAGLWKEVTKINGKT